MSLMEQKLSQTAPERIAPEPNVKSAVEADIPFGFGSDWPASLEPELKGFFQMQGFITRSNPRDAGSGTLNASQAITLAQAVEGFTLGSVQTLGFEVRTGFEYYSGLWRA